MDKHKIIRAIARKNAFEEYLAMTLSGNGDTSKLPRPQPVGKQTGRIMFQVIHDIDIAIRGGGQWNADIILRIDEAKRAYLSEQEYEIVTREKHSLANPDLWEQVEKMLGGVMEQYGASEVRMIVNKLYTQRRM